MYIKKFLAILLIGCLMLFSSACKTLEEKEETKPENKVMNISTKDIAGSSEKSTKQKFGDAFISLQKGIDKNGNLTSKLMLSGGDFKEKVLWQSSEGEGLEPTISYDGEQVYFAAVDGEKGTLYKADAKTGQCNLITEVKGLDSLSGYYDDKLYYAVRSEGKPGNKDVFYFDCSAQSTECFREDFQIEGQSGKYLLGFYMDENDEENFISVDLNSDEENPIPPCNQAVISGDQIYFVQEGEDGDSINVCDMDGQNAEELIEFEDGDVQTLGEDTAEIVFSDGTIKEYDYEQQEVTEIQDEFEQQEADYTLYQPLLQQTAQTYSDSSSCGYTLYDLDGDGTKELLLLEGTCEADLQWKVFTLIDDESAYVGSFSGFHSALYAGESGCVYNVSGHMGVYSVWEIKVRGGAVIETFIYEEEIDSETASVTEDRFTQNLLDIVEIDDYRLLNPEENQVELLGTWENLETTCMADVISLTFEDESQVTCFFSREVLYGTYSIEDNKIRILLTGGESYSNVDGEWSDIENRTMEIEGILEEGTLAVIIHDAADWEATLTKIE